MIRVTQVLSLFQNLWKIPQDVLARKGAIGSDLHEAILGYLFRVHTEMIDSVITDGSVAAYLLSFHRWAIEKKFSLKLYEERMSNESLGLTGQPDAVFEVDGFNYLYDWKTSAMEDPVCWRLQGTAYIHLLRCAGYEVSDTFFFLKLRKDGKRADTFAYKYTEEGWQTFLKALDCAKYFQKWKGALPDQED